MSEFVVNEAQMQAIADVFVFYIKKQIRDGIDGEGNPFPQGVTLFDTGNFIDSIEGVLTEPAYVEIKSNVVYGDRLLEKYYETGIAPQYQEDLERDIEKILFDGVLYNTE